MIVNTEAWWYKIPAQYKEHLIYNKPRDLCSLVRSLFTGWLAALVINSFFALLGLSIINTAFCWIVGWGDRPSFISTTGILGSALIAAFVLGAILVMLNILWNDYISGWISDYSYNRRAANYNKRIEKHMLKMSRRENSVIYNWWKGLKEKTCVLVKYE